MDEKRQKKIGTIASRRGWAPIADKKIESRNRPGKKMFRITTATRYDGNCDSGFDGSRDSLATGASPNKEWPLCALLIFPLKLSSSLHALGGKVLEQTRQQNHVLLFVRSLRHAQRMTTSTAGGVIASLIYLH